MDLGYNFFNSSIPATVPATEPNLRKFFCCCIAYSLLFACWALSKFLIHSAYLDPLGVLFLENNDMVGTLPESFGTLDWSKYSIMYETTDKSAL